MINLKKITGLILSAVLLLGILSGCKSTAQTENPALGKSTLSDLVTETDDGVVASVNGQDITADDVDDFLPILRYIYQKNPEDDDWDDFYAYAVEYLASGILYSYMLDEYNLVIDEDELEQSMDEIKAAAGGENEFYEEIREFDVTEDMIREFLRYNMAYTLVYIEATKDIEISDEEIQEYFEENIDEFTNVTSRDFHQILYDTKEAAQADLDKILDGSTTFDELAGEDEGYMATVAPGELLEAFEDIVWGLKENEIYGEVVESDIGFHIITARNFYENYDYEIDEVRDVIVTYLSQQKAAERMDDFITENIQKYKMSIYWTEIS